ncbi:hypothetical protein ACMFMF_007912 [Clarireedia jacksonii]
MVPGRFLCQGNNPRVCVFLTRTIQFSVHPTLFFSFSSLLCLLLLTTPTNASLTLERFSSWYPKWHDAFANITATACAPQFAAWKEHKQSPSPSTNYSSIDPGFKIWGPGTVSAFLIDCILEHTPELIKSSIPSTQVMILATLGAGVQETSLLLVGGEHQVLAFLLCVGSPAVVVDAAEINFQEQFAQIRDLYLWIPLGFFARTGAGRKWVLLGEYVVATAAIINVAWLSYEVALRGVFTISKSGSWLPALWTFMGVVIHLFGAAALWLLIRRAGVVGKGNEKQSAKGRGKKIAVLSWIKTQFSPVRAGGGDYKKLGHMESLSRTLFYILLAWFTTVLAACNLLFGTILFSSLLFVNPTDGIFIALRYMASVVFCKLIMTYELAVLRYAIRYEVQEEEKRRDGEGGFGAGSGEMDWEMAGLKGAYTLRKDTLVQD